MATGVPFSSCHFQLRVEHARDLQRSVAQADGIGPLSPPEDAVFHVEVPPQHEHRHRLVQWIGPRRASAGVLSRAAPARRRHDSYRFSGFVGRASGVRVRMPRNVSAVLRIRAAERLVTRFAAAILPGSHYTDTARPVQAHPSAPSGADPKSRIRLCVACRVPSVSVAGSPRSAASAFGSCSQRSGRAVRARPGR